MTYEIKEYTSNENLETVEYQTMLEAVKANRVFDVKLGKDGNFTVGECCDGWFGVDVTPDQLRALANELIALANSQDR